MARRHKMELGGLNVKVHPHDNGTYIDLIEAIFELKRVVKVYGDRYAIITTLNRSHEDEDLVFGVLSTFLSTEMEGDWFNTETLKEASNNEIRRIKIPRNLHPNLKNFRFLFNVKNHEFIFEHYSEGDRLTHNSALNLLRELVDDRRIKSRFGDVKVNLITEKGGVGRIFAIPRITELEVYIERPNSDLWGEDFEEQAEEHLKDKHARSMNVRYKAERGGGIQKDDDLDALIRASLNNGRSVAKGYGPDGHMTVSTDRFPKVVQEMYEPDVDSGAVFRRLARTFRR